MTITIKRNAIGVQSAIVITMIVIKIRRTRIKRKRKMSTQEMISIILVEDDAKLTIAMDRSRHNHTTKRDNCKISGSTMIVRRTSDTRIIVAISAGSLVILDNTSDPRRNNHHQPNLWLPQTSKKGESSIHCFIC
mgnify:CR=1 FL=1